MDKSLLVLKFGGTSVKNLEAMRKAAELCVNEDFDHVLVISSAISGITNKLVQLADELKKGNYDINKNVVEIVEIHMSIANILKREKIDINLHLNFLAEFKHYVEQVKSEQYLSEAGYARFIAYGELLSTTLLFCVIKEKESAVKWFDIREVMHTDNNFVKAQPEFEKIEHKAHEKLLPLLRLNKLIVTQGFIGRCESGETTLLGRGGSDYTATILGAALQAGQVEIWTDVDGLMTTDPRIVSHAKTIFDITYEEASELAYFGAKVLHPLTLLPAREKGIPVLIRNSKNSGHPGTHIHLKAIDDNYRGAKAIAFKRGITIINIISSRMLMAYGFLYKVFKIFNDSKTPVDIVATSEVSISVSIDDTTNIYSIEKELEKIGNVEIIPNQSLISIVGTGIRNLPGTAARVFNTIKEININMISQGASQTNLSFIIDNDHVEEAVQLLHGELIDNNPEFIQEGKTQCV